MAILKWIHISDIHVRPSGENLKNYNSDVVLQALWKDVSARCQRIDRDLEKLDFAFITGDLAWSGNCDAPHDEYNRVYQTVIDPLCHHTGLSLNQVFLTPGNHDVNRAMITDQVVSIEQRLTSRDEVTQLFVDLDRFGADRDLLFKRLGSYFEFVQERFRHISPNPLTGTFTHDTTSSGGVGVQIIGLNSAWVSHGGSIDKENLLIGEPAIQEILSRPSPDTFRIVLIHHPLKEPSVWFRPCDRNTIGQLESLADFTLSGHVHESNVVSMVTDRGSQIHIVAGSIFESREWHSNSYNYVIFDTATRAGKVYLRRYEENAPCGPEYQKDLRSTGDYRNGVIPIVLMSLDLYDDSSKQNLRFLVQNQFEVLNRRPLLSELYPERDSMKILFPDVYVDPLVRPFKIPSSEPIKLSTWILDNIRPGRRVLLLGQAGTGKTTSLIGIQHQIASQFMAGLSDAAPLFVEAKAFNWSEPVSIDAVLQVCLSSINLPSDTMENGNLLQESMLVLFDALDEAFPSDYLRNVGVNIDKLVLSFSHIATSREDFFYRYLDNSVFCSNYFEILKIEPWEMHREVKTFLNNYFQRISKQDYLNDMQEVFDNLHRSVEEFDLPITPLSVTTFLFLWRYDRDELLKNPITTFAGLLGRFLQSWAERECKANACAFDNGDRLLLAYEEMAWTLFQARGRGLLDLTSILRRLSQSLGVDVQTLSQDRGIRSILRIRSRWETPKSEKVISFSHEAIYDYLIAKRIVNALRSDETDDNILYETVGHSINQFAREIINDKDLTERFEILHLLQRKYTDAVVSKWGVLDKAYRYLKGLVIGKRLRQKERLRQIIRRTHLCYFIGRIECDLGGDITAELFRQLIDGRLDDHVSVIVSVGSGILLSKHVDLEEIYLERLDGNDPLDVCNRSYHRVYYGDLQYVDPDTYSKDVYTEGIDDWAKTRKAILRRLSSNSIRAIRLRGLDLITFRRFCETRGIPELNDEEKSIIRNCTQGIDCVPKRKAKLIESMHSKLMALIELQPK